MGFLDRYRRLPFLEAEKQKFLALELISVIIIFMGCLTLLMTLVYESSLGGMDGETYFRILRVLSGFFIIIIGLVALMVFMYRHVTALETKLEALKAPKEPKAYEGAIEGTEYVERREAEREALDIVHFPTDEEEKERKVKEAQALAKRIKDLEESFDGMDKEMTYKKCPMCGGLYTEEWDICPKCNAKLPK